MNRRTFLAGILATGTAPWVARAGVLMPVQSVWMPSYISAFGFDYVWRDGELSDYANEALTAIVEIQNGVWAGFTGNTILISSALDPHAWPVS